MATNSSAMAISELRMYSSEEWMSLREREEEEERASESDRDTYMYRERERERERDKCSVSDQNVDIIAVKLSLALASRDWYGNSLASHMKGVACETSMGIAHTHTDTCKL